MVEVFTIIVKIGDFNFAVIGSDDSRIAQFN